MKVKTSELIDPALDWAVAKAEGYDEGWLARQMGNPNPHTRAIPAFPTDWSQGGPIIEREAISIEYKFFPRGWEARNGVNAFARGPTPLIAAMRCFVAARLGDKGDVPEELSN